MTRGRRERIAYWQSVPLRQLKILMAAAFCLFAQIGFLINLVDMGRVPLLASCIWAVFSGLMADLYLVAISRKPKMIPLVALGQTAANYLLSRGLNAWMSAGWMPVSSPEVSVRTSAIIMLVLTMAAYTLFLIFIQKEGRVAIRVQTELSLAHGIQQTLVPVVSLEAANCCVYGISVPSEKVGGDLVDCVPLADGSVVAYLVDVAGHGLQAGILMGMVKTAVRTRLLDQGSPAALFERLNTVLPQVKETHMYATCAALRIYPRGPGGETRVEYALAGHPAILHVRAANGPVEVLSDEQFPVGLLARATYRSHTATAHPGDLFLVVSDGILEAAKGDGPEFGMERLSALAMEYRERPLPLLCEAALGEVRSFGQQQDDQTLLAVRIA